ncbi:MAG TPA: response regulator transcription factor [Hymenobacter sp.]|nr:response regulator transcription factor [Hymenobacter sp.]
MSPRVLFVEDDANLGYMLSEYLALHGFSVTWARDGSEGLEQFARSDFSICLLDVMLPGMDGFAIAARIREQQPEMPFVFLTSRGLKIDKLKGFRLGCDDYITKPVDEEELIARLKAVLHRSQPTAPAAAALQLGQTIFDRGSQKVIFRGEEHHLTNKEAAVLSFLATHKNRLTERDVMLKKIWGASDFFNRRSMDVVISRLRRHLQADTSIAIRNIHGKGYILEES